MMTLAAGRHATLQDHTITGAFQQHGMASTASRFKRRHLLAEIAYTRGAADMHRMYVTPQLWLKGARLLQHGEGWHGRHDEWLSNARAHKDASANLLRQLDWSQQLQDRAHQSSNGRCAVGRAPKLTTGLQPGALWPHPKRSNRSYARRNGTAPTCFAACHILC
jgi:hypothetical protein